MSVCLCVLLPAPICYFLFLVIFLVACGPPAAELVQLGLLGSLRNLPVRERVQLAHLSQLRLHHGRLGLHREGDRRVPALAAPPPAPSQPAAGVTAVGAWKLKMNTKRSVGDEAEDFFLSGCLSPEQ